jgi:uncharacterized NAD(P)/FAD-binding protein YdhS
MQRTTNKIAIIGAGVSGRLLAMNLRRQARPPARILLIDRREEQYLGPAYSDDADNLLLNVPAERMGAFPDRPEHFLNWARQNGVPPVLGTSSRARAETQRPTLMQQSQREPTTGTHIERVRGEATDIETAGDSATIHLEAGDFVAEKAVLALGNFLPRQPQIENQAAFGSRRYVRNPWDAGVLDTVSRNETVFLIGTGQTMVDLVVALNQRAHAGRIVALSRHGALPAHRRTAPYPSFFNEIAESRRLVDIFSKVRSHVQRARSIGIDASAVIDSLRPDTQTLWLGLPVEEKRRFLRHAFRHWEVIRSRIPPQSEAVIETMRASGQLEIVAGRVRDLVETEVTMKVHYTLRAGAGKVIDEAGLVINCIGPETDYGRVEDCLVKNLMRRGLIRPGPAGLGIDALPNGAVIDRDGVESGVLYTIGSSMKGVLWEVLAIPDIRVQADRLAQLLVCNNSNSLSRA